MAKRRYRRILSSLLILILLAGSGGAFWWNWATKPYGESGKTEIFAVTPGMNASQIAQELEQRHLIRNAWAFRVLASQQKVDSKLFAGEYLLSAQMSPKEMIQQLIAGPEVATVRITLPEGYTTTQIIEHLVSKGLGTKEEYLKVLAEDNFPYAFLAGVPAGEKRLDGFLFPDTYFIDQKASPHEIIDVMLKRFEEELSPEVDAKLKEMNFSIYQWVTLASIVEKEAVKQEDRPIIAGVFMNRLKTNMPLQSCATIQYLLGTPKAVLYEKDLKIPSPYNTYLNAGLPPGPIASPGHASLDAVIHMTPTDYFYFLAKGDGYHVFSKTYDEHLANQAKYLP